MIVWLGKNEFDLAEFQLEFCRCEDRELQAVLVDLFERSETRLEKPKLSLLKRDEASIECEGFDVLIRQNDRRLTFEGGFHGSSKAPLRFLERLAHEFAPTHIELTPAGATRATTSPYNREGLLFMRAMTTQLSEYQTISISEHPVYGKLLVLDGDVQLSEYDEATYSRELVQLGLTETTRSACVLGGGDCGVLRELLAAGLESVVMVELDSLVVELCEAHLPGIVAGSVRDPRAEIVFGNAFTYLRETDKRFDLIVYDLTDQPIEGIDQQQVMRLVARALAPGGRFCAQSGSPAAWNAEHHKRFLTAVRGAFDEVEEREILIPCFNEHPWTMCSGVRGSEERFGL